jgi:hypothetical protein
LNSSVPLSTGDTTLGFVFVFDIDFVFALVVVFALAHRHVLRGSLLLVRFEGDGV